MGAPRSGIVSAALLVASSCGVSDRADTGSSASPPAPATAATASGFATEPSLTDEQRQLDLMVQEADALTAAGSSCPKMTAALVAVRQKVDKERAEITARIAKKRQAGEKEPPLDEKSKERFLYVKKVTIESLDRCRDHAPFLAALTDEPGTTASSPQDRDENGWILYRDAQGRFQAKFPAPPESGQRRGPSSLTEAVTLTSGGALYSAALMTLEQPGAYDCKTVLAAVVTRAELESCKVTATRKADDQERPGIELTLECADGVSGIKHAVCDTRPDKKLVYLFECQALTANSSNKEAARTFLDACTSAPPAGPR